MIAEDPRRYLTVRLELEGLDSNVARYHLENELGAANPSSEAMSPSDMRPFARYRTASSRRTESMTSEKVVPSRASRR